jgi:hypothetical protein
MTMQRNWQQRHKRPGKTKQRHNTICTIKDKQRKKSLKTPKGGNQNPYIEEQTTQRQKEEFEDTKGAIRIRISKKNKQHKGQLKKKGKTTISKKYP